jgi:hypothetical protein
LPTQGGQVRAQALGQTGLKPLQVAVHDHSLGRGGIDPVQNAARSIVERR